jgi:hypothetical protein
MTPFPPDRPPENQFNDHKLVHFLRQHRRSMPPAAPNLEAQILAAIARPARRPRTPLLRRWRWLPALAAVAIAILSYRPFTPVTLSEAELSTIAALMDAPTANDAAEPDLLRLFEL